MRSSNLSLLRQMLRALRYFYRQPVNLFRWVRKNSVRESYMLDLHGVPSSMVLSRFMDSLLLITKDPKLKNLDINLCLVLAPDGLCQISDLFMLFSFLPKRGHLELFESLEDCQRHHRHLVHGLFDLSFLPEGNRESSLASLTKSMSHFGPPMYSLSQARSFLKTFGRERRIYLCDLADIKGEKLPPSWSQFFTAVAQFDKETLFLVLTPRDLRDEQSIYPNVVFIKELGMNLLDLCALARTADGFIGGFDILARFALSRDIPIILTSNEPLSAEKDPRFVVLRENVSAEELVSLVQEIPIESRAALVPQ